MGCGPSSTTAQGPKGPVVEGAILVHSAKNLRDSADLLSGCDPYVLCRLGALSADFNEKPASTQRRSATVTGNANPVWRLAFNFSVPGQKTSLELHLRVFDKDHMTADEFLGEARIPLTELLAQPDTYKDYPLKLSGKEGSTVSIMTGSKVAKALEEDLKEALAIRSGWLGPIYTVADKLGQMFNSAVSTPHYWANMLQMGYAWSKPVGNGTDAFVEWFRERTVDSQTGKDTYRWSGPHVENSTTFNGHADCDQRLQSLGTSLGTNNGDGKSFKPNYLGFQALNPQFFSEVPWHGISLAMPQETHAWMRPLIVRLGRRWDVQWLEKEAANFFHGRETIRVAEDIRAWGCRIMHYVFLRDKLTEAEAQEFMSTQSSVMALIGSPETAVTAPGLKELFNVPKLLAFRKKQILRYKPLIKQALPEETAKLSDEQLTHFAAAMLDAFLFAGGQSVPTVIAYAITLPYSAWGEKNLPAGFSLHQPSKLPAYIWEVLRRFPPVSGFVYTERSHGQSPDERVFLNLHLAQQDPRVWDGDSALQFKLRPLSEYHAKGLGFAESAVAPNLDSPNARACPAKDLAYAMALAFVREFARSAATANGGHKAYWKPRALDKMESDGEHPLLKPEELSVSLYGITYYELAKDASAKGPEETGPTGAHLLKGLSAKEEQALRKHVQKHNKMLDVSFSTRVFVEVVQRGITPGFEMSGKMAKAPKQESFTDSDFTKAPIGGLTFFNRDEDELNSEFEIFGKMLMFALTQQKDVSDGESKLTWFDSTEEAMMSMDETFGPYLPVQFSTWEGISTDAGMRALCIYGLGSYYLRPVRSKDASGHEVPVNAAFEVNLEYMSQYAVRKPWISYGHTAYLGAPGSDSALPGPLLGIWSCQQKKLLRPGGATWDHAKAGFRSSLLTSTTLRDHLLHSHFIYGNGLVLAARRKLSSTHPIRCFVKQYHFGTSSVNRTALDSLVPVGQVAHRTFAFTDKSWINYFADLIADWKWVPFPEKMQQTGLPAALLDNMPLAADGTLLWRTFEAHVKEYLAIFYPSEDSVRNDAELRGFWEDFETQFSVPWRLPSLSLGNLTTFLTDMFWWATAGHEFAGAIVEYLSSPLGMASKLVDGKTVPDVETWTKDLTLIALTGVKMPPLMDDWTHLFQVTSWETSKREAAIKVIRKFQASLAVCSAEISNRNDKRERQGERRCTTFDPRTLETSVSI